MIHKLIGAMLVAVGVALTAIALVGLQGSTSTAEAQPLPPAKFYGTVTANGAPAPVGSAIRAKIGDVVCGQTTVANIAGVGTNAYNIDVSHSGFQANCGDPGDTVVFEWASTPSGAEFVVCSPTGNWNNTSFNLLNLTCGGGPPPTTPPATTPPATPTRTPTATPAATTPGATPTQPAAAPPTGVGNDDSGNSGWIALVLTAVAVAGAGTYLALRRNAR